MNKLVEKQTFLYTLVRSTSGRHFLEADLGGHGVVVTCVWEGSTSGNKYSAQPRLRSPRRDWLRARHARQLMFQTTEMFLNVM